MKALLDGDILRYEIGFGAETMAKGTFGPDAVPPWDMVDNLLEDRLAEVKAMTAADDYQIYITEGRTFRYDLAITKPYKGTRKENKPWHFENLTSHLVNVLGAQVVKQLEADDQLALDHLASGGSTILCSRDKDLRQIPGPFFSWELGNQPSFGPLVIEDAGALELLSPKKLVGSGFAFFCAQVLMGDPTDNVPGLPGCGPVKAYEVLEGCSTKEALMDTVVDMYRGEGDEYLLEQGRLVWITRRLNPDGTPVLWEIGMME